MPNVIEYGCKTIGLKKKLHKRQAREEITKCTKGRGS
jgi:hypothetical protein